MTVFKAAGPAFSPRPSGSVQSTKRQPGKAITAMYAGDQWAPAATLCDRCRYAGEGCEHCVRAKVPEVIDGRTKSCRILSAKAVLL